jgi:hypothetical protein
MTSAKTPPPQVQGANEMSSDGDSISEESRSESEPYETGE